MSRETSNHYDDNYFAWQGPIGEFGGWADLAKFKGYISEKDDVLDFGCGGGFLLKNLRCKKRVGIELNSHAAEVARKNGIEMYQCITDVPDEYVDIIISNHALEHCCCPLDVLRMLKRKLKKSGKIIFVVPCESISCQYLPSDINHHFYTWSPMCLGNLFKEAGYLLIESKAYFPKWPPRY